MGQTMGRTRTPEAARSEPQRLVQLGTSTISDAMDRLGIAGQAFGVHAIRPGMVLAGPAFTIKYEPVGDEGGTVGDFIDDVPVEAVIAIDNGGRTDVTVWGDILTSVAHVRGVQGTVIDGVCRDVGRILELDYPVFSVGHWMRTGKDRVRMVATDVPIRIGGVSVSPGDMIVGDEDGVLAIPSRRVSEVLEAAESIGAAEDSIREMASAGMRLDEARSQGGYHHLQTRVEPSEDAE
jgi:4-hydroxy-4-methyl-2-oxoglutarate aldolase